MAISDCLKNQTLISWIFLQVATDLCAMLSGSTNSSDSGDTRRRWTDVMFKSRLFFLVASFQMDVCRKWALVLLPVSKHYALFGRGFSLNPRVVNFLKDTGGLKPPMSFRKIFAMLYPKLPRGGDRTYIIRTDKSRSGIFFSVRLFHESLIWNLLEWRSLCSYL